MIEFHYIEKNIQVILEKMKKRLQKYDGKFPRDTCNDSTYDLKCTNDGWTEGLFVGQIWLCYELSNEPFFLNYAIKYTDKIIDRIKNYETLECNYFSFLFSPSLKAAYLNTGNNKYLKYYIEAGEALTKRYRNRGEFIQSWGILGDPMEYRITSDSLMNLTILYDTAVAQNNNGFKNMADNHLNKTINNLIRDNYSSYQSYYFQSETGNPAYGETVHGVDDNSTLARGHAWITTGIAYSNRYLSNNNKVLFDKVVEYYMSHLPNDGIAYWDFSYTDFKKSYKDSSSNAIVLCGLLEMKSYYDTNEYNDYIESLLYDLQVECVDANTSNEAVITQSVYDVLNNNGIDCGTIWGDYFYTEALIRIKKPDWKSYW